MMRMFYLHPTTHNANAESKISRGLLLGRGVERLPFGRAADILVAVLGHLLLLSRALRYIIIRTPFGGAVAVPNQGRVGSAGDEAQALFQMHCSHVVGKPGPDAQSVKFWKHH